MKNCEAAEKNVKIAIIGGGPAGLAAALGAVEGGVKPSDILIIERDSYLGGILNQCIHAGFGLHMFGEELSGPEYALRYINKVKDAGIPYVTDAMTLSVGRDKTVTYVSPRDGLVKLRAEAVILAMGCRERPRGALNTPGTRPAGVYTAGTAQRFINIEGYMPGREVVILGSGDIGLIMARRMTLEGASVKAVCELMPYSSGLARNIAQCLDDFGIPLKLSHTVVKIHGKKRVEGVTIAKVDEHLKPIAETEEYIPCDTLLLSVGLIPENELTEMAGIEMDRVTSGAVVNNYRETSVPGIFACGNVLHVHDLVDFVSGESELAGKSAALYVDGKLKTGGKEIKTFGENGVRYIVPQKVSEEALATDTEFFFRVGSVIRNAYIEVRSGGEVIYRKKKPRLAPGEMEHLTLDEKAVETAKKNGELVFSISEK